MTGEVAKEWTPLICRIGLALSVICTASRMNEKEQLSTFVGGRIATKEKGQGGRDKETVGVSLLLSCAILIALRLRLEQSIIALEADSHRLQLVTSKLCYE